MKVLTRFKLFFASFFFVLSSSTYALSHEDMRIFKDDGDSEVEILYLFSYHCPGCFALDDYISLYERSSKTTIKRIPFFYNETWKDGALTYLKLISLRERRLIENERNIHKFGYYLHMQDRSRVFTDEILTHPLWNITRSDINLAEIFAEDAISIIEKILTEIKKEGVSSTPTVRVSNKKTVRYISIDEEQENPGLHFIQSLHSAIKEMGF